MFTLRRHRHRSPFRAASRWFALALAVLSASPFTAPFSTFDLGTLSSGKAVHRSAPVDGRSFGASMADAVFFITSIGVTDDLKNLALIPAALAPFVSRLSSPPSAAIGSSAHAPFGFVSSPVLRI